MKKLFTRMLYLGTLFFGIRVSFAETPLSLKHNAYTVLGISNQASIEEVNFAFEMFKARYNELLYNEILTDADQIIFKRAQNAFLTLSIPLSHALYRSKFIGFNAENRFAEIDFSLNPSDYLDFLKGRISEFDRGLPQDFALTRALLQQIAVLNYIFERTLAQNSQLFNGTSTWHKLKSRISESVDGLLFRIVLHFDSLDIPVHKIVEIFLNDDLKFHRRAVSVLGFIYDLYPWNNYSEFISSRIKLGNLLKKSVNKRNQKYYYGAFFIHKREQISKLFSSFSFDELQETLHFVSGYQIFLDTLEAALLKATSPVQILKVLLIREHEIFQITPEVQFASNHDIDRQQFDRLKTKLIKKYYDKFLSLSPSPAQLREFESFAGFNKNIFQKTVKIVQKCRITLSQFLKSKISF